jgi:thioesterase domain-containing protein
MAEMALYARVLGQASMPIAAWGLLARGLDGREPPHACVEEMARDYLVQVRRLQPCGPWLIAGECVGGVIAHEMVCQLREQGDDAALLLLDSWYPNAARERSYRRWQRPLTLARERWALRGAAWTDLGAVLLQHLRALPDVPARKLPRHAGAIARTLLRVALAWRRKIAHVGQPETGAREAFDVGENYIAVTMRHRPRSGDMRAALLVSARNRQLGLPRDWQRLLPGLAVVTAPGTHESYLRDAPATAAARLQTCIAALDHRAPSQDPRP